MELNDILAISGQPGLYKFIARSTRGVIVESLLDGKRINAATNSKVSAMSDISIFTEDGDLPLAKVFESIYTLSGGKETISHKSSESEVEALFAQAVPTYDRTRVYLSDMRKVISWYNILVGQGMTEFKVAENAAEQSIFE